MIYIKNLISIINVYDWLKNEEELRNVHYPKNKKALHPGKAFSFNKEEKEIIINFVETVISNFIPLNYHKAVEKIISMNLEILKGLSYKAKYKRIIRFLKSNYYTNRKATHIGQTFPMTPQIKHYIF